MKTAERGYVSLVRCRINGQLYRIGDPVTDLSDDDAVPLVALGWLVEGITELPEGAEPEDGQSTPAKKGKGGK